MEFTCAICQVICSGASELTIHAASHISTIRKPFQCSVSGCGTEFKHLHHLRRHMKFIHSADNNARAYDCSECTRTYSDSRKLETHLANHHNIIKCCRLGCSSTFSTKSQLKLHKQVCLTFRPCQRATANITRTTLEALLLHKKWWLSKRKMQNIDTMASLHHKIRHHHCKPPRRRFTIQYILAHRLQIFPL